MLGKLTGRTVKASLGWEGAQLLVDVSSSEVPQVQCFEESVTKSPKQVRGVHDKSTRVAGYVVGGYSEHFTRRS